MTRTEMRELAFKLIYSRFFTNEENALDMETMDKDSLEFVTKILKSFAQNYAEINEQIATKLQGYTIERLYKVDLAILTLAVIEINFIKETPKEVVINEAIELAKKYSTEKSPKFINGVLADIVK